MALTIGKQRNELSTYQQRIEILVGARFKETNRIATAKKIQDDLRQKIGHWQGAEEIKKWRMRQS